jgi:isopenicillin-N epimerase
MGEWRTSTMKNKYKEQFMLDPEIHFLNHGSFGACSKPVFDTLIGWQKRLEYRPIEVLDRRMAEEMKNSRKALADFLTCPPEDVVYFPNPTTAINMVVRSLDLQPGDEILSTDHEYGAMDRTWKYMAQMTGACFINQPVSLPVTTHEAFVDNFWQGVTDRTKVIFLSQITSQTALIFPVGEICRRAREAGILTIIDGAHAPGQIPVNLDEMAPDLYTGACHKWMCAPKGSAFLYARKEVQTRLDPLVVSWGYQAEHPSESQFVDYHEWQGTRDISAFLSVPAAIKFQEENDWDQVRANCHFLVMETRSRLHQLIDLPKICPDGQEWLGQMAAIPLPEVDTARLQRRLLNEYRVEVPVYRWQKQPFLRISVQAYNSIQDLDVLENALAVLLPQEVFQ